MIKRLQLTLLSLFVCVCAIASETSFENADGVEIWYNFDVDTKTASVTYMGSDMDSYDDEYTGDLVIPSAIAYKGDVYKVTTIEEYAFHECSQLSSVTLGKYMVDLDHNPFSACFGLTDIYVVSDNENYTSVDGVLYNKDKTKILIYPEGKKDTSYVILDGVKEIEDRAFKDCKTLTSVTIPSSVTKIGSAAFFNCNALTGITIPSSVIKIGSAAFSNCDALTSITIPNSVTEIGLQAFADCDTLTNITIPESVTKIRFAAFSDCDALTNITIPESVTEIGDYVFSDCDALTNIDVASNNNYFASIEPKNYMLFVPHINKPNMVAQVASVLGADNINISGMLVAQNNVEADKKIVSIVGDDFEILETYSSSYGMYEQIWKIC